MPEKNPNPINFASPLITNEDISAVTQTLTLGHLSFGPEVGKFEAALSRMHEDKPVLAMSSGTTALHAIFLSALSQRLLFPGDEILIPAFTFAAPLNMAITTGLTPRLVDVSPETFMPTAALYEAARTKKTKAIVIVHIYGHPAPMPELVHWANQHKLLMIEDAAESFGAKLDNKYVGTFGDLAALSFQSTKSLSIGEGGAVIASNPSLIEKLNLFRSHGMGGQKYFHHLIGHNFRLTSYQAALGLSKLGRFSQTALELRQRYQTLKEMIQERNLPITLQSSHSQSLPVPWGFPIVLQNIKARERIIQHAAEEAIEIRPFFVLFTQMPLYHSQHFTVMPIAEQLAKIGLVLPLHNALSTDDLERLVNLMAHSRLA